MNVAESTYMSFSRSEIITASGLNEVGQLRQNRQQIQKRGGDRHQTTERRLLV